MENEEKFPNIPEQAINFAGSLFNHALTGFGNVDEETFKKRMNECFSCQFYASGVDKCSKCGCKCRKKASWSSTKCPIGKW